MKGSRHVLLLCGFALGCSPTGPSGSLTGTWVARGIGHGSLQFEMSLQQSGDTISGVACGVSSGVVMFRNAAVQGEHPRVRFIVTAESTTSCCAYLAGGEFTGRIDDTRDIVGTSTFGSDLRFRRSSDATICGG